MGQKIEEQLSALLDGELPVEEEELLLRRLGQNADYHAILGRFSLIGELMRDAMADPAALQIGDRIRAAVTEEGAHSGSLRPATAWRGMGKGLVGAGIAVAVAMVALTVVFGPDTESGSGPAPALARVEPSYTVPVGRAGLRVIAPVRLTGYLVAHGEFSGALSRRAMDSRIVRQRPETAWQVRMTSEDE